GRTKACFHAAAVLSAEALDRCFWIACADRPFLPHSPACGRTSSLGRRTAGSFLAGAPGVEGARFPDLQISNARSTIRLCRQSHTGGQATFSNWPVSAYHAYR